MGILILYLSGVRSNGRIVVEGSRAVARGQWHACLSGEDRKHDINYKEMATSGPDAPLRKHLQL